MNRKTTIISAAAAGVLAPRTSTRVPDMQF